jgi:hypothetical protein
VVRGRNRIMIYGPKNDGTYVVEFRTSEGEALAISIPRSETAAFGTSKSECRMASMCRTATQRAKLWRS